MFRALSDIWDGSFCGGVVDFELWTDFVRSVQSCVQTLLGHLRWDFLQQWALSMSQAASGYKISTIAINSKI